MKKMMKMDEMPEKDMGKDHAKDTMMKEKDMMMPMAKPSRADMAKRLKDCMKKD